MKARIGNLCWFFSAMGIALAALSIWGLIIGVSFLTGAIIQAAIFLDGIVLVICMIALSVLLIRGGRAERGINIVRVATMCFVLAVQLFGPSLVVRAYDRLFFREHLSEFDRVILCDEVRDASNGRLIDLPSEFQNLAKDGQVEIAITDSVRNVLFAVRRLAPGGGTYYVYTRSEQTVFDKLPWYKVTRLRRFWYYVEEN